MQFLEHSVVGLRAARHRFARGDGGIVTLFAMVHLGEAAFYDAVRAEAASHDFVLFEGVDAPVVDRLTRSYRWAAARRLGLVLQPKGMFIGQEGAIRADLDPAEFQALWARLPRTERLAMTLGAPAIGLWRRLTATRRSLAEGLCTDDLPARADILAWSRRRAPFIEAVVTARDARLVRVLRHLIAGRGQGRRIAVVYGAGHMGAARRALTEAGYRPNDSAWMTVFQT